MNSHVAWGNCVTPLFTTTAGWLLARAARLGDAPTGLSRTGGLLLVLACAAFGLALQTHPSVAVLLPGVGLYIVWQRRRWLLSPWPYLGAATLLAAQAPTLLYIGRAGLGAWLDAIREKQEMYERDGALGLPEIAERLRPGRPHPRRGARRPPQRPRYRRCRRPGTRPSCWRSASPSSRSPGSSVVASR